MSKIKMIKTHTGSLDGISIRKFDKGMVYSIPDQISLHLSELFLSMGVAKIARERNIHEDAKKVDPVESKIEAPEKAVVETPELKEEPEIIEEDKQESETEETEETEEKKMQIYMLASELNVPWKEIVKIAKKFNIGVKNHMSVLSEEEVITIKESLG